MTGNGTVMGGGTVPDPVASAPAPGAPAPATPAPRRSSVIVTIAALTARGLLGRRRSLLLVLLALLPVAAAILVRVAGRDAADDEVATAIMDRLLVTTLLPIVGLVFGTAALGAELEDGTAVFILVKPIERWRIVLGKLIVAVGLSIALVAPASFIAGAILGPGGTGISGGVGAAVGTAIGATVYATVFFALSLVTGRALAIGLVYVLVWEGVLAGLLEGVAALSIRQYTLAITAAISTPGATDPGLLDPRVALALSAVAVAVAALVAVRRLSSYEIGQAGD